MGGDSNFSLRRENFNCKISWTYSATGDRYPVDVNSNHPVWQQFLESGCKSPTQFFRAFFSPPTYFHSPRPWRGHGRLVKKVSELLDSFRPGSCSYRPFKHSNWVTDPNDSPFPSDQNNDIHNMRIENNSNGRNGIYFDIARPRPFYRVSNVGMQRSPTPSPLNSASLQSADMLLNIAKASLIRSYGLRKLWQILHSETLVNCLPSLIRDQILTLSSSDFHEVSDAVLSSESSVSKFSPKSPVTYKVQCKFDSQIYQAFFFTSEVDKLVSNLWENFRPWMVLNDPRVIPVLALVTDSVTENVFIIVEPFEEATDTMKIARLRDQLMEKFRDDIPFSKYIEESSNYFVMRENNCYLKHPLLFQKFR